MLTSTDLELRTELTLGTLESNAEHIKNFVEEHLKDYTPENYIGQADKAKADRAVLNNAEKALNSRRLELERKYMEPFNNFKGLINDACKMLKTASGELDAIVKAEEEREKAEKFEKIQEYWNNTGFSLFDISRVFNAKWTNKTTKLKDVYAEIDQIQKRTFDDLAVIENFPKEDVPLIKAVYLETLVLSDAVAKAKQLNENRDRLAREKKEREEVETMQALKLQRASELEEVNEVAQGHGIEGLVAAAMDLEEQPEEKEEYALVFKGTRDQLLNMKREMTRLGITYKNLTAKGNGVYVQEDK